MLSSVNEDALKEVHVSHSATAIAEQAAKSKESPAIIVVDDFAITGVRIGGAAKKMWLALLEQGYTQEEAHNLIEVDVMAARRKEAYTYNSGERGNVNLPFHLFAHYAVDEYTNSEGEWYFNPGISVTGSHCSTDYGFERVLGDFANVLKRAGEPNEAVWLTYIRRPYEDATRSGSTIDQAYLQRLTHMEDQFGIQRSI